MMKMMLSLMASPAFEVMPGPGSGSGGQPVVRLRSFEGAGPVIATEAGDKDIRFSQHLCATHTQHLPAVSMLPF